MLLHVTVVEKRDSPTGLRYVMKFSYVDDEGEVTRTVKSLYYLEVEEGGARTVRRPGDDGLPIHMPGRFSPFTCSRPPALGFQTDAVKEGYIGPTAEGIVFSRSEATGSEAVVIEAAFFQLPECPDGFKPGPDSGAVWFGPQAAEEIALLEGHEVHFIETQRWSHPSAWFFAEMERRDPKGNVVMRCRFLREVDGER